MAKRITCGFCTADPNKRGARAEAVDDAGVVVVYRPLFRSKRQLARHLQHEHQDNKTAQKRATQLLAEVRQNRKEQR